MSYWQMFKRAVGVTLAAIVFGFGFLLLILNWMSGCGEAFPYYDKQGQLQYVEGECIGPIELFQEPTEEELRKWQQIK